MERAFPAYKGDQPYIFVSYAHEDSDLVFPEIQWLRDQGFNIWYDEGISPGASWRQELADFIDGSSLFLYLVTPPSIISSHCQKELNYALEHHKPVIAVHLKRTVLPGGMALTLGDIQAILKQELTESDYRIKLALGVSQYIQQAAARPESFGISQNENNKGHIILARFGQLDTLVQAVIIGGVIIPIFFGVLNLIPKAPPILVQVNIDELLQRQVDPILRDNESLKRQLEKALHKISQLQISSKSETRDAAILAARELNEGNTAKAKQLFRDIFETAESEDIPALVSAYLNYGSLAYLGDTVEAFSVFNRVIELDPYNLTAWNQLGRLQQRIGDLDAAHQSYLKVLELAPDDKNWIATSYRNLGNIHKSRGDHVQALEFYGKALDLHLELGRQEGMAKDYNYMGNVYRARGDLDEALAFYGKALDLNLKLTHKEGLAKDYNNIGNVHQAGGDTDQALEFYGKALDLNLQLGHKEGIAIQYGNMGIVYHMRRDLDQALEFYGKALNLNLQLDRKEGIAMQYGNIGLVHQMKEDLDQALVFHGKALDLHLELGRKEGMAKDYNNIGNVHRVSGDLDQALVFYGKALDVNTHKAGIAKVYSNIGIVLVQQLQFDKAIESWSNARNLYEQLGADTEVQKYQAWIDEINQKPE